MRNTLWAAVILCCGWASGAQVASSPAHPCLPCHPAEVERFTNSPMGRSLSIPAKEPDGQFVHQASGATVSIFRKDGVMHHKIEERGLSADYPISYAVGFGTVGRSYLIELGGHFFQSPAAFYTKRAEWDSSPGYETERILDFTRPITSDCLVCHAGAVEKSASKTVLTPIGCNRCHGDGENHRLHPFPGTIVNPAKLPNRERDSICEQCHLESATVVLNPNQYWWDFRPGERLEQVEAHYVYRAANDEQLPIGAVSQAEQLALSACARLSGGKLWCGTCHNPHGEPVAHKPKGAAPDERKNSADLAASGKSVVRVSSMDRRRQIKQICESCHAPAEVAAIHKQEPEDCIACHMPRRQAVDVSHAAITDHRIAKHPAEIGAPSGQKVLAPWHNPEPQFASRDLGLAYFNVAKREGSGSEFQKAFEMLSPLAAAQEDPAICAALGYMLLGAGRAQMAVQWLQRAVTLQPDSAEYWLDMGVAQNAADNSALAVESFRRSIQENPYDYRPYKALADLYDSHKQLQQARAVRNQFLHLVPQSILMRIYP